MRPLSVIILAGDCNGQAHSTVGGKRALEWILQAAASCRRLLPLSQSVHVVLSASAAEQAGAQLQGYGLSSAKVISNGVGAGGEWKGDVEDLRLALQTTGVSHHVLAVSANRLTFAPGYNFQRLVEHGLTRDADAVGMQELGPVELELLGHSNHTIAHSYDAPHLVPPLATVEVIAAADEGMWGLQPLLFLTPHTLAGATLQSSNASDLVALATQLFDGNGKAKLHGLSLGPGVLHTGNSKALTYAYKCALHLLPLIPQRPDQQQTASGEDPVALQPQVAAAHGPAEMEQLLTSFNNDFFGLTKLKAKETVPATFFMTNYRRQAADLLR